MKYGNKEPKLTYALDSSGKMVSIGCVERGLSCNCRCPKCNESLVARLGHEGGRQPHFAHQKGSDCHGSYMTALHHLAEQIIEEEKAVMAPAYKVINEQKLSFKYVEVEQRVERKDLQPDLVGITEDGLRWFIEIKNTHVVDESKKAKLIESNITCLEIDVSEQTLEGLKSFLLESTESREWINNQKKKKKLENTYRDKVSAIVKQFEENPELEVPNGDNIILRDLSVSVLEDGLYARIKAVSSNGIPYLFHIGSTEVLGQIKPAKKCNELTIDTGKQHFSNGVISVSNMKRINFFIPKKENEVKTGELKENPEYEVRLKSDCNSRCKYHPFLGKCIYSKKIFSQDGVDYVVCNRGKRLKDEADVPSHKQISDTPFSYDTRHQQLDDDYRKGNIREGNYTEIPLIKQKHEEPVGHPLSKQSQDSLPFERFRTIEDIYTQLKVSSSYETEKGQLAEIVKCERTKSAILLLYRDSKQIRTYCPFHIVIINVINGNMNSRKVADFLDLKSAFSSYYNRLKDMNESFFRMSPEGIGVSDLPF